jgi:hypothetical protein
MAALTAGCCCASVDLAAVGVEATVPSGDAYPNGVDHDEVLVVERARASTTGQASRAHADDSR